MGAIADAMSRFAQPLIDATDGSVEDLRRTLSLSQLCWNLALMPEGERDRFLSDMQPTLKMDDEEFQNFKEGIALPMIRRHQEMFPAMHQPDGAGNPFHPEGRHTMSPRAPQRPAKKYAGTGRNECCPCGSGKKYKRCCGQ